VDDKWSVLIRRNAASRLPAHWQPFSYAPKLGRSFRFGEAPQAAILQSLDYRLREDLPRRWRFGSLYDTI